MKQKELKKLSNFVLDKIVKSKNNFSNVPFKHLYVDNFFPEELLKRLSADAVNFVAKEVSRSMKLPAPDWRAISECCRSVKAFLMKLLSHGPPVSISHNPGSLRRKSASDNSPEMVRDNLSLLKTPAYSLHLSMKDRGRKGNRSRRDKSATLDSHEVSTCWRSSPPHIAL